MVTAWMVFFVAAVVSVWMILTYIWMQEFDDAGEPWWAVYVPVYNLVCMLRTVEASPYWAWLIVAMTIFAIGVAEHGIRSSMVVEVQRGSMIIAFLIAGAGPWLIHSRLIKKKRGLI